MSETETVRVRIAVAVDKDGQWAACGADNVPHAASEREAKRGLGLSSGDAFSVTWIEADVPLPLPPQTIEGTVTPAEEG